MRVGGRAWGIPKPLEIAVIEANEVFTPPLGTGLIFPKGQLGLNAE